MAATTVVNRLFKSLRFGPFPQTLRFYSLEESSLNEYTKTPEYPPIYCTAKLGKKEENIRLYKENLKNLPSVEQKLYAMCEYKPLYRMIPYHIHTDPLPFVKYCTRTHVIEGLPDIYQQLNVDSLYENLKPHLINAIKTELSSIQRFHEGNEAEAAADLKKARVEGIIRQILRILTCGLSVKYPHLKEAQIDTEARVDAYWRCRFLESRRLGIVPYRGEKEYERRKSPFTNRSVRFQYAEHTFKQLRSNHPLPEFVSIDDDLCTQSKVPVFEYHPKTIGYYYERRYSTLIPGFWSNNPFKYGFLSFHTRKGLDEYVNYIGNVDVEDQIISAGIFASYSWLLSLATLNGFTPFNEVTYPTVTQTVTTDGQNWSFFAYQMNTVLTNEDDNERCNICWHTKDMKLFETVTADDIVGLNDDVLKTLIKFMCYEPREREGVDMSPYLGVDNNLSEEERRDLNYFLPRHYSNRPEYRKEMPLWKLYYRDYKERMPSKK